MLTADVGVVGAGVVGLAATDALARAGADVRCFESGEPGRGGSAGLTRIFRHVHEEPRLVALVKRALAGWREWEERCGRRLVGEEGFLFAGPEPEPWAARLAAEGIPASLLEGEEVRAAFPALAPAPLRAVHDPAAGAIRARRTIETLAGWAGDRLVRAEVFGIHPDGASAAVHTSEGVWRCGHVLVCAGPRTPAFAAALGVEAPIRMFCHVRPSFRVRAELAGRRLPCFVDLTDAFGERVYGSPVGGTGLYALGLVPEEDQLPLAPDRLVIPEAFDPAATLRRLSTYVERALPGFEPEPASTRTCVNVVLPWAADAFAAWQAGPVTIFAEGEAQKEATSPTGPFRLTVSVDPGK